MALASLTLLSLYKIIDLEHAVDRLVERPKFSEVAHANRNPGQVRQKLRAGQRENKTSTTLPP